MSTRRRLTYQPALDGIRALSVIAVILFHAGISGFGGGYVGVSVFFTLSGFLITSLLVAERLQENTIELSRFYARRARRLLPASILCVVAVVIASATTDWFDAIVDLRTQVIGSLLQVENWVLLAGAGSYQRLFADGAERASPLAHFWSLAIEEQFYWVWPITLWAIFKVVGPRRSTSHHGGRRDVRRGDSTLEGTVTVPRRADRGRATPRDARSTSRRDGRRVIDRGDGTGARTLGPSDIGETGELPVVATPADVTPGAADGDSARSTGEIWTVTRPVWQPAPGDARRRLPVDPYPIAGIGNIDQMPELPSFPAPTSNRVALPEPAVPGADATGEIPVLATASASATPSVAPPLGRADHEAFVPRPVVATVVALTVLAAAAAPLIAWVWGPDAAYWATPARLAEILIGASASVLLYGRTIHHRWNRLGWLGLIALLGCVVLFPIAGGPAYRGAMPLVALASVGLVVGAQANGSLQRTLSNSVLVEVGKVSYGAYLYHWPIFVVVNTQRTGWPPATVLIARLGLTAAATLVSYRLIELPMRRPRWVASRLTLASGVAATAIAIVLGSTLVPANAPYWETSEANAAEVAIRPDQPAPAAATTTPRVVVATGPQPTEPEPVTAESTAPASTSTGPSAATTPESNPTETSKPVPSTAEAATALTPIDRPLRVVVAGDSTGGTLATGLIEWAVDNPGLLQIEDLTVGGCGVLTGGDRLYGTWGVVPEGCDRHIRVDVPEAVERLQPDVVLISAAVWDLPDRRWDGVIYTPFDQYFQDRVLFEYTLTANHSIDAGAESVALIINPLTNTDWKGEAPSDDPDRHEVLDSILRRIAANRPEHIRAVDLRTYIDDQQLTSSREARPDGVHWTPATAQAIAQNFLVAELFRAASVLPPDVLATAASLPSPSSGDPQDRPTGSGPVTSAP